MRLTLCNNLHIILLMLFIHVVWLIQTLFNTNGFKQSPATPFNDTLLYEAGVLHTGLLMVKNRQSTLDEEAQKED